MRAPRADALQVTEEKSATATASRPVPTATVPTVPAQARPAGAPPALVPARDDFTFTAPPVRRTTASAARAARAPQALVWTSTAVAVVVLSAFFVLIVSGRVVTEGPVLLTLTQTHGVHLGDLFALAAWGVAVVALLASALAVRSMR